MQTPTIYEKSLTPPPTPVKNYHGLDWDGAWEYVQTVCDNNSCKYEETMPKICEEPAEDTRSYQNGPYFTIVYCYIPDRCLRKMMTSLFYEMASNGDYVSLRVPEAKSLFFLEMIAKYHILTKFSDKMPEGTTEPEKFELNLGWDLTLTDMINNADLCCKYAMVLDVKFPRELSENTIDRINEYDRYLDEHEMGINMLKCGATTRDGVSFYIAWPKHNFNYIIDIIDFCVEFKCEVMIHFE